MIYHSVNVYRSKNEAENQRMKRAQSTWMSLYRAHAKLFVPAYLTKIQRTLEGEERGVPFVKDVIQVAVQKATRDDDVIVLTNADTSMCRETIQRIMTKLFEEECCFSNRREMDKPQPYWLTQEQLLQKGEDSKGTDLFAFKVGWWKRLEYPDLLIGYEGWDWVMQYSMPATARLKQEVVYHESHLLPYWYRKRQVSKGNLYNRKLCWEWVKDKPEVKRQWPGIELYGKDRQL